MRVRQNRRVLTGIVAVLSTLGLAAVQLPAHADPVERSSYYGVGSDTTQSVVNALTGAEPNPEWAKATPANIFYTPVHSDVASGQKTLSSLNAIAQGNGIDAPPPPGGCVSTRPGGPSFDRPNGSGNGILALRASFGKAPAPVNGFVAPANSCTGTSVNIPGQIDFARSSRGPNATAVNDFTWIPFARDALSYAVYSEGSISPSVFTLTTANLTSLFTRGTGSIVVGGTTVKACLPQGGSGTRSFWVGAIGVTDAQAKAAAIASGCGDTVEEHHGDSFKNLADPIVSSGQAAVVAFSVAQWIGQANGNQDDSSGVARAAGVDLGDIDNKAGGAHPYTGTAPSLVPDAAYYFQTGPTLGTFGRDVYNVLRTTRISGGGADSALVSLFVGPTSAVCQATATINKFGFLGLDGLSGHTACGATTLTGSN